MEWTTIDKILQTRLGGKVKRCHTFPHHGEYNVAMHSWGVAMLLHYIYPADFTRLVSHCLMHDVAEAWVGDIPAPIKRYNPHLKAVLENLEDTINEKLGATSEGQLGPTDASKLRVCDNLEFYLWCREQLAMGNSLIKEALAESKSYLLAEPFPPPAGNILKRLMTMDDIQPGLKRCEIIKKLLGQHNT